MGVAVCFCPRLGTVVFGGTGAVGLALGAAGLSAGHTLGTGVLVGTDGDAILSQSRRLLDDAEHRASFAKKGMPFGDGTASIKIRDICAEYLNNGKK